VRLWSTEIANLLVETRDEVGLCLVGCLDCQRKRIQPWYFLQHCNRNPQWYLPLLRLDPELYQNQLQQTIAVVSAGSLGICWSEEKDGYPTPLPGFLSHLSTQSSPRLSACCVTMVPARISDPSVHQQHSILMICTLNTTVGVEKQACCTRHL